MGQLRLLIGAEIEAPKQNVRYVYRAKRYAEPPADWPAPKHPCIACQDKGWPASWRWAGYEWRCTVKHE